MRSSTPRPFPGRIIDAAAFSPDGRRLAAAGIAPGGVVVWEAETGPTVRTCTTPGAGRTSAVRYSPDGTYLAAGDDGQSLAVWNAADVRTPSPLPSGARR
jgi:WD40 repeat protein